jgi:hypothetical protein
MRSEGWLSLGMDSASSTFVIRTPESGSLALLCAKRLKNTLA